MTLNVVGEAIRTALIGDAPIADDLSDWKGEPAVFTRRPTPADANGPMIIVNPDAAISDDDALNSERPVIIRDVAVYGKKGPPGDASDQTRIVERIGYRMRKLFHRQKFSLVLDGYSVIDIVVAGPTPAPVDDDVTVGRLVGLTIRLSRRNP